MIAVEHDEVVLADERLRLTCLPRQGATITALVERSTGVDALWRRPHTPALCTRSLGAPGPASSASFGDLWVGGWFDMLPVVGHPSEDTADPANLLHGELVRLPWECETVEPTRLVCSVRCVRVPLSVVREIQLDGEGGLSIDTRVTNVGGATIPYSWGFHPCFDRAVFAAGRIELDAESARIPDPPSAPGHNRLPAGECFAWPWVGEPPIDVSRIPELPTGSQDHVAVEPRAGHLRLTAPRHGLEFVLDWDLGAFPHLLMWQDFVSQSGWPLWGAGDVFALEPSTNPGRGVEDAAAAGAVRELAPDATVATTVRARWQPYHHKGESADDDRNDP